LPAVLDGRKGEGGGVRHDSIRALCGRSRDGMGSQVTIAGTNLP
jgi:hypothetical protein